MTMRLKLAKGWLPTLVITLPSVPRGTAMSLGPIVLIEQDAWDDPARRDPLLAHELQHSVDAFRRGYLGYAPYLWSRTFRRKMEVRGYAAQARAYVRQGMAEVEALDRCAYYLSKRRDIGYTKDEARAALLRELGWEDGDDA